MRTVNIAPKASMLIESMRDLGYSLATALADVVDNSITAGATTIHLFADICGSESKIGILDNGKGMSEADLIEAMRPGSKNPLEERHPSDLGRFGLGLKTASFSQCRRLTVVTRQEACTSSAVWDLDHVAETDEWLVQIPDNPLLSPWADRLGEHGTLVVWEKLDRLSAQRDLQGGSTDSIREIDKARRHLELVFQRFLSGERGLKKIRILLNNRQLEPFDPFYSEHSATESGPVEVIKIANHEVTIQAYTLPHYSKVTASQWEHYAGRDGYLKNQGFYVYREKRLIMHGGWFGLARLMELTKLARVRIDMPNGLDAEWKIDVKKASAHPPWQVRERLRRIIEALGANSKRVFTTRGRALVMDNHLPFWNRVKERNEIVYRINTEHPVLTDFTDRLPDELKKSFLHVLELTGASLPLQALFADLSGEPGKVACSAISDEALREVLITMVKSLIDSGLQIEVIASTLRMAEPFRSNWASTEKYLKIFSEGASNV